MKRHPHAQLDVLIPLLSQQHQLSGESGSHGVVDLPKGGTASVAHGAEDDSVMPLNGIPQNPVVPCHNPRHHARVALPQLRTSFYVRIEEGNCSLWPGVALGNGQRPNLLADAVGYTSN
jgi:hypothetical protein